MISPFAKPANVFKSSLSKLSDSILSLVYPQACQICEKSVENHSNGSICEACWLDTQTFNGSETLCSKCGVFLMNTPSSFPAFCRRCDDDQYDVAKAIGGYEKAFLAAILQLKTTPHVPKRIEKLLFEAYLNSDFHDAEVIIPVPLSKKRFAERGYNQAMLLAESLAPKIGVTIDNTSFKRKVHTEKDRAGMDRKARRESVKNSFELVSPRLINGKNILLIDDVFTSGATVSACAKVLKKAGAAKVYVLTVARAI